MSTSTRTRSTGTTSRSYETIELRVRRIVFNREAAQMIDAALSDSIPNEIWMMTNLKVAGADKFHGGEIPGHLLLGIMDSLNVTLESSIVNRVDPLLAESVEVTLSVRIINRDAKNRNREARRRGEPPVPYLTYIGEVASETLPLTWEDRHWLDQETESPAPEPGHAKSPNPDSGFTVLWDLIDLDLEPEEPAQPMNAVRNGSSAVQNRRRTGPGKVYEYGTESDDLLLGWRLYNFDIGGDELKARDHLSSMESGLIPFLQENRDAITVRVVGHASPRSEPRFDNADLSQRRAERVAQYLQRNVPGLRIDEVVGGGVASSWRDIFYYDSSPPSEWPAESARQYRWYRGVAIEVLQRVQTVQADPCAGVARELTLSTEGSADGGAFSDPWVSVEQMTVRELFGWSLPRRIRWYKREMCRYRDQLRESAQSNGVPMHLIATVVLNEMADIDWTDQVQDFLDLNYTSVGPAQIQVSTATAHNLVDIPSSISDREEYVSERLQIMQVAIEAAARYIRVNINRMHRRISSAWQQAHGFTGYSASAFYASVSGTTELQRVQWMTEMVIAAYNSPDISRALDPGTPMLQGGTSSGPYPNGRIHGYNGSRIATDLYSAGMFLGTDLVGPSPTP